MAPMSENPRRTGAARNCRSFYRAGSWSASSFVTMAVGVNARTAFTALSADPRRVRLETAAVTRRRLLVRLPDLGPGDPLYRPGGWIGAGRRSSSRAGAMTMGAGFLLATLVHDPVAASTWTLGAAGRRRGQLPGLYGAVVIYLPNWFVGRRGLAISIAFSGVGLRLDHDPAVAAIADRVPAGGACGGAGMLGILVLGAARLR